MFYLVSAFQCASADASAFEVDSARDHQNQVFLPCVDPAMTPPPPSPPRVPRTPEHPVGYYEVRNELYSPAAFQRATAHVFVAI